MVSSVSLPFSCPCSALRDFGSLFSCPHLSLAKEISNKLQEWNWVPLRWNFFLWEFKSGGCRGPTYQATGQVWGLTAWLQTIMNPLYNAQLAPRSAGVREGSCSNQRLLHTTEWKVSLSAPNPDPSSLLSMPFCYAECDCWFLLSPSFLNSGRAHLHPWVTHSLIQSTNMYYSPTWCPVHGRVLAGPSLLLWKAWFSSILASSVHILGLEP